MKRLTLIIAAGLLSLGAGVVNAQNAGEDAASMADLLNRFSKVRHAIRRKHASVKRNSTSSAISSRTC